MWLGLFVWGLWLSIGRELLYRGIAFLVTCYVWELLSWGLASLLGDLFLVELLCRKCASFLSCLLWSSGWSFFTDWIRLYLPSWVFAFPLVSLLRDLLENLLSWYLLSLGGRLSWELAISVTCFLIDLLLYGICLIRTYNLLCYVMLVEDLYSVVTL